MAKQNKVCQNSLSKRKRRNNEENNSQSFNSAGKHSAPRCTTALSRCRFCSLHCAAPRIAPGRASALGTLILAK